ncbi:N-acetyltransferase [Pseudomonas aeruginosa]|nr:MULTISPECIES: hypothetical protein [Pseudomonas]KAB0704444.1 N-acetyltransferase [Pseudomonas aeruginosa]MBG4046560.1 N-acetyltransferase [Pseudomonas aeruginosa]MBG6660989.1 N-acetyltransferase [Pseudomonas aeruginosa]MBI8028268.1 N-acetyltransferase [Pseudomonas aeruginosa]MBI8408552.1 N-acetyltransferase [Pseudomonas aeruginosa]
MDLELKKFKDIDLTDPFFDSLKSSYKEFVEWFERKGNEKAYVFLKSSGALDGFLYLKLEDGLVDDVLPPLPSAKRLKVGTMKINAHGTKMGERFIKKIIDHAISFAVDEVYVTVFKEHEGLIQLLKKYGFMQQGVKKTLNGVELVLVKNMKSNYVSQFQSYPLVSLKGVRCYVVAIDPRWHTRLLPDSMLSNESSDIVEDISSANSIHKIYMAGMQGMENLRAGDVIVIYRMSDGQGPAHYRSVATSIGVVEEYRHISNFSCKQEFFRYCEPHSVFKAPELERLWMRKNYPHVFKFSYNLALKKKVTRQVLIEELGFPGGNQYWGFFEIPASHVKAVAKRGMIHEGLIVD